MDKPICCDRPMSKNGKQKEKQRWRCSICGKTQTTESEGKGRKRVYKSNAEKQRAYRMRIALPKEETKDETK